ncbi:MAG: SRPBCC family protein [Pseudomonadota bacterium]
MPELKKTHIVKHSAIDMFDLVCDIEKYPEFVPLVQRLNVRSHKERGDKKLVMAAMTMGYLAIQETFTTQVFMNQKALEIDVSYIDGPFEYLENTWSFHALSDSSCEIHFHVNYALKNKMLAAAAGAVFDRAFSRFVNAFEERADTIYKKNAPENRG